MSNTIFKLKHVDGYYIFINADHISNFYQMDDKVTLYICLTNRLSYHVEMVTDQLLEMFKESFYMVKEHAKKV
jgi:hypothetical protein